MLTKYAIIVAGGSGTRMQSVVPKQFLELDGIPVIFHTLMKFQDIADHIIVVLPRDQMETWEKLKEKYHPHYRLYTAEGGVTRSESVRSGLEQIYESDGLVAIHDAVRPFVSEIVIENSYRQAAEKGSAVVAVPVKDSIRKVTDGVSVALDRSEYYLMQTPQTFRLPLIKKAYANVKGEFTDDAAVFEADGQTVHLINGTYDNLKITTPEDLHFGEAILKMGRQN
jgi:2-C-methyl-D-erythritol 4-phosphate cytidylyltransferase